LTATSTLLDIGELSNDLHEPRIIQHLIQRIISLLKIITISVILVIAMQIKLQEVNNQANSLFDGLSCLGVLPHSAGSKAN